jgi:spore maturation protein CgeB
MRILLLGVDDGKFPGFSYQCMEAIRKLGHEGKYLSFRKYKFHKNSLTNRILNKWLYSSAARYNPDLLLVNKGTNILPGYIEKLSKKGIKTANWTLDEPFGAVNSFNRIGNIAEYDYFFVFDPYYVPKLKEINPNSYYLPCAADPEDTNKEVIPVSDRTYPYDVAFVGSHDKKREDLLKDYAAYNIKVAGFRWGGITGELKGKVDPQIYAGPGMCRIFNQSKVNINIHAPHSIEGVNIRTFEIPACNSFQLCDYYSEIPKLFEMGKEIVCYRDKKELKELVDYYIDDTNKEERKRIGAAGCVRVKKEHTVRHRIEEIVRIVK